MTPHVTWAKGGDAWVLSASQDAIVLRSTIPSPPGSRIDGTLMASAAATEASAPSEGARAPVALRVKIHGCKRQDDGTFRLEGRPLDLTREVRAELEALAAKSA